MNITPNFRFQRVMNSVAAGVTDQNSNGVDVSEYRGVVFIAALGALTAGQQTSVKAQQSDDDGASDAYSDIKSSQTTIMDDADGNKIVVLEVNRPLKKYVRAVVQRGTQNAVIDGVIAQLHSPRVTPVTQHSTVQEARIVVNPEEGIA